MHDQILTGKNANMRTSTGFSFKKRYKTSNAPPHRRIKRGTVYDNIAIRDRR